MKLDGEDICLAECILQLVASDGTHRPQLQFENKSVFRNAYFFSQVLIMAAVKAAVKCHWDLYNTVSSLCHTQFGLETTVFSQENAQISFEISVFYVSYLYVWI